MIERGDLGDPPVGAADDVQLEGDPLRRAAPQQVASGGWHPVRRRGQQPPLAELRAIERHGHQLRHLLTAGEVHRLRRHRDPHVLADQRERGRRILPLMGVDERGQQAAVGFGQPVGGPAGIALWQPLGQGGSRPL